MQHSERKQTRLERVNHLSTCHRISCLTTFPGLRCRPVMRQPLTGAASLLVGKQADCSGCDDPLAENRLGHIVRCSSNVCTPLRHSIKPRTMNMQLTAFLMPTK